MLKEDFAIQSQVRRMLVRSNIDYSGIDFGTVRRVVYMRGLFKLSRIYVDRDEKVIEFTSKTLTALEKKIKMIPGVSDVIFQFVNWQKEKGQWVPIEVAQKAR